MTYNTPELLLVGAAQNLVLGDRISLGSAIECFAPDHPDVGGSASIELW
jgi:hypothetical protein